jgi:hypothetical protein
MRALNSGRRWGSDVPTFKDILHAVGVLYDRFQQRSTVLTSICDRVEGVSKNFAKVTNNFQTLCSGTKNIAHAHVFIRLKTKQIQRFVRQMACLQLLREAIHWYQEENNQRMN